MTPQDSHPTRLSDYIAFTLPWAHGHQLKGITDFVWAIISEQTACQAQIARCFGNQEAALKRLSRLLHNERLDPKRLADSVLQQAIYQLPKKGRIRLAIDWTIEGDQHLLVVSLIQGRRGLPIYWRAYETSVLKGRMKRYELSVVCRVLSRLLQVVDKRRVIVTADRGFADVPLFELLESFEVKYVIRVKASTKVCLKGHWMRLAQIRFLGNERHLSLGVLLYRQSAPKPLWVSKCRARDAKGKWGIWHLVSNHPYDAKGACEEYGRRFGCEEGFRDAKWWLGFAKARIHQIRAWSRMFALFVIALLVLATLGSELLLKPGEPALALLRRVMSRRRGRCELALISTITSLLSRDQTLYEALRPHIPLSLERVLENVS